jgi:hypothetical protein
MLPSFHKKQINQVGSVLILVVVFTGIFLVIITGLLGVVYYQQKLNNQYIAKVQALHIAEAGINYYRWHLAHDPNDFTDNTGGAGPYIHAYNDPTTDLVGTFSLEIDQPPIGSTIVTIRSTGWINKYPQLKKTIEVKYGKPSLAHFSYLTNTDIWLGESESVSGQMHANGGIRMDGTNDSLVTSAKTTYICTPDHGCSNEEKPGVWGAGPNSDLWSFPEPEIDFVTITMDLSNLKTQAQADGNYYAASNYGYLVRFQNNGTYDLYTITSLYDSLRQIDDDDFSGYEYKAEEIKNMTFLANHPLPNNGIIFIEDDVWVEGTVNGKVTLVSATFPDTLSTNTSIFINNNVRYVARDGNNALGLIAQKNIQVPRHAPTNLYIDGVMLAQKGRVYRAYYYYSSDRLIKNYIEVYGGIITNKIWTWTWVSGSTTVDGYNQTKSIYDTKLTFSPPPYFPTSGDYTFITWEEQPN